MIYFKRKYNNSLALPTHPSLLDFDGSSCIRKGGDFPVRFFGLPPG